MLSAPMEKSFSNSSETGRVLYILRMGIVKYLPSELKTHWLGTYLLCRALSLFHTRPDGV